MVCDMQVEEIAKGNTSSIGLLIAIKGSSPSEIKELF